MRIWLQACRPKTLMAGICPVILGTVLAARMGYFDVVLSIFTLFVALGIQIGTNFANDYFDFIKGADTSLRKGPVRVTSAGLVAPQTMRLAVFLTFSATALLSTYLIRQGGPLIACFSTTAIFLGIAYTGGPFPLAYLGLGDLFVLIFFGPVATAGTTFLQTHAYSLEATLLGLGLGLISTAILTVNNLRDVDEDRRSNKKTLVVRFGTRFGKIEYIGCIVLAALLPLSLGYISSLFALIPGFFLIRQLGNEQGYNDLLAKTGGLLLLYTALLSAELLFRGL